jgi:hypothetical protein
MTKSPCETLADLYHYFDQLAEQDVDSDTLFTSSYIRGFISLAASEYGDEQQPLSNSLADAVSIQLHQSRSELSPQDRVIVSEYWQKLRGNFS